jgi:hypothetical protein
MNTYDKPDLTSPSEKYNYNTFEVGMNTEVLLKIFGEILVSYIRKNV